MTKPYLYKTKFWYLILIMLIFSCGNNNDTRKLEDVNTKIDTQQKVEISKVIDTSSHSMPQRNENRKMHFPEGMFKTYPQIVNNIFAVGTSKEELVNILGNPELVEESTKKVENTTIFNDVEIWYYGEMIIELTNDVISGVSNYENNQHCFYNYGIEMPDLLISDLAIEKRWALHLEQNIIKADRSVY